MIEGTEVLDLITALVNMLLSALVLLMALYLSAKNGNKIINQLCRPCKFGLGFLFASSSFNALSHAFPDIYRGLNIFEHLCFMAAVVCFSYMIPRVYNLVVKK